MNQDDDRRDDTDPTLSSLYRATRREQPPAGLDARLLEQARRQAARRRHRWWLPLSSAAVILLGVSLLLELDRVEPLLRGPLPSQRESPRRDAGEMFPRPATQAPAAEGGISLGEEHGAVEAKRRRTLSTQSDAERPERIAEPVALPQRARPKAELDGMPSEGEEVPWRREPRGWIASMRRMLEEGRKEAAKRELALFRQRYPRQPLPAVLEALDDGAP